MFQPKKEHHARALNKLDIDLFCSFLLKIRNVFIRAAEQKARSTYDNILRVIDDPDVADPIRFLRQREIVHFQRFGEGLRLVQDDLDPKNFYQYNPGFDRCKK